MRVLLIHNPKAGDRKHTKKQLMGLLTKFGHEVLYQSTKKRGWKKAIKKPPVDLVIAAGGDGTVRKTAWQIIGSGVPLLILPLGTANNLARTLGFAAPLEEIVESLQCGRRRPFDVGMACSASQCEYFLEAAGGGLFADYFPVAEAEEKEDAPPKEKLTAQLSLLRRLALHYPAHHWNLSIDGEDISGEYILWGVMNIRSAGPALHLALKATTHDGLLDFVGVREHEREILIRHVEAHLAGRKERVPLRPRRFRQLKITSPDGSMHLDGKTWPAKKNKKKLKSLRAVEITVKPAALMIWQPEALIRMRRKKAARAR